MPPKQKTTQASDDTGRNRLKPPKRVYAKEIRALLKRVNLSQSEAAAQMGVHPTVLSLLISGKQLWQVEWLIRFSSIVGVRVTDMLRLAGYPAAERRAPVLGTVNGAARLLPLTVLDARAEPMPSDFCGSYVCAVFDTRDTRLSPFDGAVLFWDETTRFDDRAVGKLSIVRPAEGAAPVLGVLRSRKVGEYLLTPFWAPKGEDIGVERGPCTWAAPVLWMRMV